MSFFTFKYTVPYCKSPSEKVEALDKARGAKPASIIQVQLLQSTPGFKQWIGFIPYSIHYADPDGLVLEEWMDVQYIYL